MRVFFLTIGLFVLAALLEIGGAYLMWQWFRHGHAWTYGALGAAALVTYGIVQTYQLGPFERVYAVYGGIFIAGALLWGWAVDGNPPDRWDIAGSALCIAGAFVMLFAPRGG